MRLVLLVLLALPGCYLAHAIPGDGGGDAGSDAPDAVPSDVPVGPPVTRACGAGIAPPSVAGIVPCDIEGPGDADGDGFENSIDCNDCVPQINEGAYDVPGDGVDGDCDGTDAAPLDDAVSVSDEGASAAACAIGLCATTDRDSFRWGLLSSRWTTADGSQIPAAHSHHIVTAFGTYGPVDGARMLALSTGLAAPGAAGCYVSDLFEGLDAPGFPVSSPACPFVESYPGMVFDSVALEVQLRVPTNAVGIQFSSNFMTREYPDYLCTVFNDVYAVFLNDGRGYANIVFDRAGNPVTVNNALLRTCVERGPLDCELGAAPLAGAFGTGIDACIATDDIGAGTDCISTTAAVRGGAVIQLRFTIWDSADQVLDSIALLDGFSFVLAPFEMTASP